MTDNIVSFEEYLNQRQNQTASSKDNLEYVSDVADAFANALGSHEILSQVDLQQAGWTKTWITQALASLPEKFDSMTDVFDPLLSMMLVIEKDITPVLQAGRWLSQHVRNVITVWDGKGATDTVDYPEMMLIFSLGYGCRLSVKVTSFNGSVDRDTAIKRTIADRGSLPHFVIGFCDQLDASVPVHGLYEPYLIKRIADEVYATGCTKTGGWEKVDNRDHEIPDVTTRFSYAISVEPAIIYTWSLTINTNIYTVDGHNKGNSP